ncbi:hypothetical protein Q5H93_07525 [Hymenobacter sp. ASUV-10]|uniref:Uncharacterized protein n=1 Tax=Hymenobacter aranciens TaxID=3063996 RepID=A0ABT9B8R9_9BACT|nr:hypothetical protein [Hymenobacter sp. ASUV-10]MDO7874577.1 hypothetical protein [Hymenobacter sp. ASUV-10]
MTKLIQRLRYFRSASLARQLFGRKRGFVRPALALADRGKTAARRFGERHKSAGFYFSCLVVRTVLLGLNFW